MKSSPKTVFITGTDSGIGLATVQLFLAKGWNVVACKQKSDSVGGSNNPKLLELVIDITDSQSINDARDKAIESFGQVDVLVNNAGYGLYGPLEAITNEQFRQQFEVNVFGLVSVTKAFITHLRERRNGTIVNIASMIGQLSIPQFSAYAASKWAVEGFSESLTYELAPFNIKIKIIEPGTIATNFFTSSFVTATAEGMKPYEPSAARTLKKLIEKGERGGSPERTAEVIYKAATSTSSRLRYRQEWTAHFLLTMRSLVSNRFFRFIMSKAMG
jgi:NAD(P)-dependent dehydrogenase (short-subunit alcohol dehydrogenase family)